MLDWTAIEDAIHAWAKAALGVEVIWANQGGTQPPWPYATLKISGPGQLNTTPFVMHDYNAANPAGQEIEQTAVLPEEVTVSLQVFAGPVTGSGSARALLGAARANLSLPSSRAALRAAGLAVIDAADTLDLTALVETGWQSRAAMDLRMNLVDTATEKTGYIATANVSGAATP